MNILVLGSGGREHALAWRLSKDPGVKKVFVQPGNPGIELEQNISTIEGGLDFPSVQSACQKIRPELVVIGPEAPLAAGLSEQLQEAGLTTYGPSKQAAQLESSKVFAKNFMRKMNIPTARFSVYNSSDEAIAGLEEWDIQGTGVVIKADGLAAGKGVVVTKDLEKARKTIELFMNDPNCSVKTDQILIEECLCGWELSLFALCDGENFFNLGYARDYKRVGDGDQGPNTGGMGCHTPQNWPGLQVIKDAEELILAPTLEGMRNANSPFCGTLFAGLMLNGNDVKLIEYNVRFGDPETQTLLPLLEGNLTEALLACAGNGDITKTNLRMNGQKAVHVVQASAGYPSIDNSPLDLGHPISFKQDLEHGKVFFAGVKKDGEQLVNSSGRVMGYTATAESLAEARKRAYQAIDSMGFKGAHFRKDIGLIV